MGDIHVVQSMPVDFDSGEAGESATLCYECYDDLVEFNAAKGIDTYAEPFDESFYAESPFSGSYPPSDEEWEFIQKELRRKGIDTYAEPFDEIGNFYSGKKGMLKIVGLGALVSAGIWITKNKLLE